VKTSKIIHVTDTILKPKKMNDLITSYKALAEKQSMTLAEFKRRYNEMDTSQPIDIGFYCYILKIIASKDQDVLKVLAMSQDQEVVCIEVWDKNYITAKAFPKEKSYVYFDNLTYCQSVLVKKKDSFEIF
jgi:hypothetical protein